MSAINTGIKAADPFVLHASNGKYYLYATNEGNNEKDGFKVYSSDELYNWKESKNILLAKDSKWATDHFWAPECYEIDGKYYLFYSANWKDNPNNDEENFRIGVALANDPLGPFKDIYDRPIFDPGYPVIDANVYYEDGKYYLYYSRCCYKHDVNGVEESWIYGVRLKPDFSGIIGEPVLLLKPEQQWEDLSRNEHNRRWNEGSFIFKYQSKYFMTYSSNYFLGEHYSVGYAYSNDPLGPFKKAAENPILKSNGIITGTGHNCVFNAKDNRMMVCYHGQSKESDKDRIALISSAFIDGNERLIIKY